MARRKQPSREPPLDPLADDDVAMFDYDRLAPGTNLATMPQPQAISPSRT